MLHSVCRFGHLATCFATVLLACGIAAAEGFIPDGAEVGQCQPGESLHLVSAMEVGGYVNAGGWHLNDRGVRKAAAAIGAKLGRDAMVLFGTADGSGNGDFAVSHRVPGKMLALGCWVYIAEGANVKEVGFQIYDHEGEALLWVTPVNWTGWKWIETPVTAAAFKQAYAQAEKNSTPDMPIGSVHVIWWSKQTGLSEVAVDGVVAKVVKPAAQHAQPIGLELLAATDVERNAQYGGTIILTNQTDKPLDVDVELSLQQDGNLYDKPLPDAVDGSDHALGAHSWAIADGEQIAENTLTDGLDYTTAETKYIGSHWESADQYLELDRVCTITAMGWRSGDANWLWKVDVSASADGKSFAPVPELQNYDMHKKWSLKRFPDFKPFAAKVIRFHYHNNGEKTNIIRMPAAVSVYDGVADEDMSLPRAGAEVGHVKITRKLQPGGFTVENFQFDEALDTGEYLLAARTSAGSFVRLDRHHVLVEPAWLDGVDASSRFGLNAANSSLAAEHRKLGIGWVRFENFKWPMVSPEPHKYAFDGTVTPWVVNHDQIVADYRKAGLNVLPMMFLTPTWASEAEGKVDRKMLLAQPPTDYADFGEFAFQSVARYGSTQVAASKLKTADKVTGAGQISVFELGNEPNLNPLRDPKKPPTWGPWASTMDEWWRMWRYGAEAVKQADPNATLSSPGFAGMTSEIVDQMRVFKYDDGKCPLDFVDIINVHFYSGRTPPERATRDANNAEGYVIDFVEHLKRLVEWRDRHKPGAPIWMSETGYDTGGPIGTNEWTQAARLPRVVALCLANGVDKVIVYRESGSTASQHAAAGVLRNDLTRKPSWYTYATLIRQLHNATAGEHLPHPNENVWLQTWQRDGQTMLMAYSITGEAKLAIELGKATMTDAYGGTRQVDSTADITLTEYPIYISDMTKIAALDPLVKQANAREQQRKQQREADAKRTMYLFNFGQAYEPVAANVGRIRYYQAVPAAMEYDASKGYGFVGKLPEREDYRHWVKSQIDRSGVKLDKGHVFRVDVEPGVYELTMNAHPWGESADITLEGATGGPIELTFVANDGETITRKITVRGRSLQFAGTYQHMLRWMVLAKQDR